MRYKLLGKSDTPAHVMAKANMYARWMGLSPVVAAQVPYNLARRDPEREIMPLAKEDDVTLFNRGQTNAHLFPEVEKLRGDRDNRVGDERVAVSGRNGQATTPLTGSGRPVCLASKSNSFSINGMHDKIN